MPLCASVARIPLASEMFFFFFILHWTYFASHVFGLFSTTLSDSAVALSLLAGAADSSCVSLGACSFF